MRCHLHTNNLKGGSALPPKRKKRRHGNVLEKSQPCSDVGFLFYITVPVKSKIWERARFLRLPPPPQKKERKEGAQRRKKKMNRNPIGNRQIYPPEPEEQQQLFFYIRPHFLAFFAFLHTHISLRSEKAALR